jgi:hypothetical protein
MWSIRLNMMTSQIPLREIPVIERGAQDTPRPYDPFRSRLLGRFQRPLLRLLEQRQNASTRITAS